MPGVRSIRFVAPDVPDQKYRQIGDKGGQDHRLDLFPSIYVDLIEQHLGLHDGADFSQTQKAKKETALVSLGIGANNYN